MNTKPRPILHIEDEDNDIYLLQRAFVSAEVWHPIQVVKTAARAFEYLLGEGSFGDRNYYPLPHLILLDLSLPSLDGLEILKWRQIHAEIRAIPVLVLTASHHSSEVRAAYAVGANGYLIKPTNFNGWVEMVKSIRIFWLDQNIFPLPLPAIENLVESPAHHNGVLSRR